MNRSEKFTEAQYAEVHRKASEFVYRNQWSLTKKQYLQLVSMHEKARNDPDGDLDLEYVEFILEDINYHYECDLLVKGEYEKARAAWEEI